MVDKSKCTFIFGIRETIGDKMTYTPHLKRKLYKTSLTKEEIVHPIELPAPDGAGKIKIMHDHFLALHW